MVHSTALLLEKDTGHRSRVSGDQKLSSQAVPQKWYQLCGSGCSGPWILPKAFYLPSIKDDQDAVGGLLSLEPKIQTVQV
jgi:hypothetical protein